MSRGEVPGEHLAQLCRDLALGAVTSVTERTEGVLNRTVVIETETGKYFIKSIREKRQGDVPYIARVESLMYERGIPAIKMLSAANGTQAFHYEHDVYTAYPFIESDTSYVFTRDDVHEFGALLARIHAAGSHDIPVELATREFLPPRRPPAREKLNRYLEALRENVSHSDVDESFVAYIKLKLDCMDRVEELAPLPNDILIHGDYHTRNLLLDRDNTVLGVCDWEQSRMGPAAYELARSILYVCFSGSDAPEDYVNELAVDYGKAFIAGYRSVRVMPSGELSLGLRLRLEKLFQSIWIEEQHYVLDDTRSDQFIPHETRLITDFMNTDIIEQLCRES